MTLVNVSSVVEIVIQVTKRKMVQVGIKNMRHDYNNEQARYIYHSVTRGLSYTNIMWIIQQEYGKKMSPQRIGQIYNDYKHIFKGESFKDYKQPKKL